MVKTGSDLGEAVLKALGIPCRNVLRVQIDCQANDLATVSVIRAVDKGEADQLTALLESYVLDPKPEDPKAAAMDTVARNLMKLHGSGSGG